MRILVALIASLYCIWCIRTPDTFHIINSVNLIFHEAGHTICMFLGTFMHVLGGSLTQVLIPLICAGYFFIKKDYFSVSILGLWVGQSIVDVARYMGDAIVQQLPLLGGDNVIHDWNWLLSTTGLLKYTDLLSDMVYGLGIVVVIFSIVFSCAIALKLFPKNENALS